MQWLCGSVGRVVASGTRGPWLESSHRQKIIYIEHLFTVNCVLAHRTFDTQKILSGANSLITASLSFAVNYDLAKMLIHILDH